MCWSKSLSLSLSDPRRIFGNKIVYNLSLNYSNLKIFRIFLISKSITIILIRIKIFHYICKLQNPISKLINTIYIYWKRYSTIIVLKATRTSALIFSFLLSTTKITLNFWCSWSTLLLVSIGCKFRLKRRRQAQSGDIKIKHRWRVRCSKMFHQRRLGAIIVNTCARSKGNEKC